MSKFGGKPVIGLTVEGRRESNPKTGGKLELNWNYAQVVADAGGVPILLPPTADPVQVAELLDGFLIPGGLDIDAAEYGEPNHPEAEVQDPTRYAFENAVYKALDPAVPVLGICYGCQFLNVAEGGTLSQHLPDQLGHDLHSGGTVQEYEIEGDSLVASALGAEKVAGKSYHHQAIARPAESIRIVGKDKEGTVEAVEVSTRALALGVQWHPERSQDDPAMRQLFANFIQKASEYRSRR